MNAICPNHPNPAPGQAGQGSADGKSQVSAQDIGAFLRFCQTPYAYTQRDELLGAAAVLSRQLFTAEGSVVLLCEPHSRETVVSAVCVENADLEQRLKNFRFNKDTNTDNLQPPGITGMVEPCEGFHAVQAQFSDNVINQLAVPLLQSGAKIGALWVINKKQGNFTSDDAQLLSAVAGVTAAAMTALEVRQQLAACDRNAQDLNQARDRATHHLSHAIKTPLSVLIACLKLLEKHLETSSLEGWQSIYERAHRNLDRLMTIEYEVEDILRQCDEENR
ncbi:MAG: hypothetical protein M0036_01715 [Desulfobacteraceae bacterium]|nr:hypothetical protein [Desulfobacteraceae bacterium]